MIEAAISEADLADLTTSGPDAMSDADADVNVPLVFGGTSGPVSPTR
jgi:hypothetical protein